MMLWAAGVMIAAGAVNQCINSSTDGFACALCATTPEYLDGNITWVPGGGLDNMPVCNDSVPDGHVSAWTALKDAKIKGAGTEYQLNGRLTISGSNVHIDDMTISAGVEITAEDSQDITITNLKVTDDAVAVRVRSSKPTGPRVNVSGLAVSNARLSNCHATATHHCAAVAMAYVTDDAFTVDCDGTTPTVVLQNNVPLLHGDVDSCKLVDLGAILQVFGSNYEVSFFNFQHHDTSPVLRALVFWLACVDVLLVFILASCYMPDVRALAETKEKPD